LAMASFSHCHNLGLPPSVQSARRAPVVSASVGTSVSVSTALDCGRVLGVRPNASKCEVKAAFRKLALRYHPDVCNGEERGVNFMEVNKAYESLMAHCDECQRCDSCEGTHSAQEEDGPWAGSLFREDYSSYYSNLKYYSKAGRNRRYSGSFQYY